MSKKKQYIAIEDLANRLGLFTEDVERWIKRDKTVIKLDLRYRPAVSIEIMDRYSSSDEYLEARKRRIDEEIAQRVSDDAEANQWLKQKRFDLLDRYDTYIADLEHLHQKHLQDANAAGYESSIMAAYLLFTRGQAGQ